MERQSPAGGRLGSKKTQETTLIPFWILSKIWNLNQYEYEFYEHIRKYEYEYEYEYLLRK